MVEMIPDGSILVVQREAFRGQRVYAGIKRPNGSIVEAPVFYRDKIDDDCDVRVLHAHSRPMLIPSNVNASAFAQVVDPTISIDDLCPVCK